jgi:hypothetical protein
MNKDGLKDLAIFYKVKEKMTNEVKTYKYWRYNPDNKLLYSKTNKIIYNTQKIYSIVVNWISPEHAGDSTVYYIDILYANRDLEQDLHETHKNGIMIVFEGSPEIQLQTRDEAYTELLDILGLDK